MKGGTVQLMEYKLYHAREPMAKQSDNLQPSLITLIGSPTFHCSFPGLDPAAGFNHFLKQL